MITVGLVGIGGMGGVHFNAYKNMEDVRVIAVADVRCDMAREKVGDYGAKIYASVDELLANEKPDIIDVCTPSYLHADIAVKALDAGIHVVCEKPMSLNTEDTKRIVEARDRSGKFFMTAHVVRFMKPYMYLKSIVDSGELGKLVYIDMKRLSEIPRWSWDNWMQDLDRSGGTPIDLSIHDIDFLRFVFGEPKSFTSSYHKLENCNDYVASTLEYDGFTATVTGGWFNAHLAFRASYLAMFQNGTVELVGGKVYKCGEQIELDLGEISENTGINLSGVDGYAGELRYFVDCVKTGTPPTVVTAESSEGSVALVEKLIKNSQI